MPQIFLISELYLYYCSCLILSDTWGADFYLLSVLRKKVYENKFLRITTVLLGFVLMVLNIFLPIDPGPVFLGDFIVVLNIFVDIFFFMFKFAKKDFAINLDKKYDALGYTTLGVTLVHLVFAQIILL